MTGMLSHLTVVEGSAFVAAPLAGMSLAQLGAQVIRFDPIEGGLDYHRWPVTGDGESIYWAGLNKGKRSVAADFRSAEGQDLVQRLIADSGVLITNVAGREWHSYDTLTRLRPDLARVHEPLQAAKLALRSVAERARELDRQISLLDQQLSGLVASAAPRTTSLLGISTQHGGQLLVSAGENIERLSSEAAFARLCGASPIPASSGRTTRHRLNRGGDRNANRALYLIAVCRLRNCARTRAYAERRIAEGLSKKEIIRCLKRYIAREVYHTLRADLAALTPPRT